MNEKRLFFEDLKEQRKSKNFTLEEISDFTKIDLKYLLSIEEGNFSVLPNVYMRLFIRSYCKYIGVESKKILDEFEFHTLGKKTKSTTTFIPKDLESDTQTNDLDEEELNLSPVPIKKIIGIIVTIFFLISIYFLVSKLSSDNKDPEIPRIKEKVSQTKVEKDIIISNVEYTPIPNDILLSNKEFNHYNFIKDTSIQLTKFPPYVFTIKSLERTKVNIVNNDSLLFNRIVEADSIYQFIVKSKISFDLWNSNHVQCTLNGVELNKIFGTTEKSIRGSFEVKNQLLWCGIYNQITY